MNAMTLNIDVDADAAGSIYIEPDMGANGLDVAFFDIFNNASDDVHQLVLDRDDVLRLADYLNTLLVCR